ncbi:MAG: uroporphyrinogen decarboxylase family protein [Candidatus Latescibacterota bacterium]
MTPRERMQRAIAHQPTDICPYVLGFSGALRQRLVGYTGNPGFDAGLEPHLMNVGPAYPETNQRLDEHRYTDAFGVIWEEAIAGEIGMVRNPVLREPSLQGYTFPPARLPGLFDDVPGQVAAHPGRYSTWSLGFSLFERAWTLRGLEPFLQDLVEHPRFAEELLERICELNLELIDQACQHPIDCVRFGDDWGAQRGLIMGPDLWRRFIRPRFVRMVERARSYGKDVLLHSDGDIVAVIPDLIDAGLTILNPVQPDVMDIYCIKRQYGQHLTFLGGVSVQHLLPEGSPEQVRAEVRRLIAQVGAGGGFIIAPTHSLGSDIPLRNLTVLVDEFTRQKGRG